jgi:hypothetical protein
LGDTTYLKLNAGGVTELAGSPGAGNRYENGHISIRNKAALPAP